MFYSGLPYPPEPLTRNARLPLLRKAGTLSNSKWHTLHPTFQSGFSIPTCHLVIADITPIRIEGCPPQDCSLLNSSRLGLSPIMSDNQP
jgi:hypothetical protein